MIGTHPSLLFDLVNVAQRERSDRLNRGALLSEAKRGHIQRGGNVNSVRRVFGAAVIGVGNWIHGDRDDSVELTDIAGAGSLRIAR
jgi:hypothetical protein